MSLEEVRTVWETNEFGALAIYQAMLPLLRKAPHASIVNVSSVLGSLTWFSNPDQPNRLLFVPTYSASKTALNAMTIAMAIELESTNIKVNAVSPGYTKTNLNNYEGTETVEEGAAEAVRAARRRWADGRVIARDDWANTMVDEEQLAMLPKRVSATACACCLGIQSRQPFLR